MAASFSATGTSLGTNVSRVAVNADSTRMYIADTSGVISVYDMVSGQVIDTISVGTSLGGMDVSPDGSFLLATQASSSGSPAAETFSVYKIDLATHQVTPFSRLFDNIEGPFNDVAMFEDGKAIVTTGIQGSGATKTYTLDLTSGSFSLLASNSAQAPILMASSDRRHIFLANGFNVSGPNQLYSESTDGSIRLDTSRFPESSGNSLAAFSADGRLIAYVERQSGIDILDDHLSRIVRLPGLAGSTGVAFDATGDYLYAVLGDGPNVSIQKISTTDWSTVAVISLSGVPSVIANNFGENLTIGPDASYFIYTTADNRLFRIDNPTALATTEGSGSGETITGTANPDVLHGNGGADTLLGDTGNDVLRGGAGNDRLDGGAGHDAMYGGDGNDTYVVNDVHDVTAEASAAGGIDTVETTVDHVLSPNIENLTAAAAPAGSNLHLTGNSLANVITGSAGNDVIDGARGNDTLYGGSGNDTLDGGAGNDTLNGGTGDDVYNVDSLGDVVVELAGQGHDTVYSTAQGFVLPDNVEDLVLKGNAYEGSGNGADNALDANWPLGTLGQGSILHGLGGNDTLTGFIEDDVLDGGTGADTMSGMGGEDTYYIDNQGDVVVEGANQGIDQVFASVTYTLAANVENLTLTGVSAINGTGNASGNTLLGNTANNILTGLDGNDTLDGGAGDDTLIGGLGDDNYVIGEAGDTIVENANEGTDNVVASVSFTLGANLENLALAGTALNGTGNGLDNFIRGNALGNRLEGGAGNDTLNGGLGADTLVGSAGNDIFEGSAAELDGDTIADLGVGERIHFTNVIPQFFSYSLSGSTLTFTGGTLILQNLPADVHLAVTSSSFGIELTLIPNIQPFINNGLSGDFNGDGRDDLVWRHDNGAFTDWLGQKSGGFVSNDANAWNSVPTSWHVAGAGDFNGDGRDDLIWRNDNGSFTSWLGQPSGGFVSNDANAWNAVPTSWHVAGTGDFNGDGRDDIVWRNDNGSFTDWLGQPSGGFVSNDANAWNSVPTAWQVVGTGDFNGDGRDDLIWRNENGSFTEWLGQKSGGFTSNDANAWNDVPTSWQVVGTGDFNGDGRDDVIWRNDNGSFTEWLGQASGGFVSNDANAWAVLPASWKVAGTGDYNGDGRTDIAWRNDNGAFTDWLGQASGGFLSNDANAWNVLPNEWKVQIADTAFA